MARLFLVMTLMIVGVGVGWRYTPPEARERLLGFIGMANRVDPARIAQDIKDKITPEDPAARRTALVGALKQKVQEIKTKAAVGENTDGSSASASAPANTSASAARAADIASSADEAVQIITQLEQSGGGASAGGQIVQRLIERILPAPQCKP